MLQVILLGRFNGQGLGSSTQDLVSSHSLEMEKCTEEEVSGPSESHHESIHIKGGSSDAKILIRTTPGEEYIKASNLFNFDCQGLMDVGRRQHFVCGLT